MNKVVKYLLIIFPILLLIILVINISIYYVDLNNNKNIIKENNGYLESIKESTTKNNELLIEIDKLKKEKKDKIWEYDRWTRWNQEIKEKIN